MAVRVFPRLGAVVLSGLALLLGACSALGPSLPDEFDAAFTVGEVCIPRQIATGPTMTYPAEFNLCLYRCVDVVPGTPTVRTVYQCAGGLCQMVMLATAHVTRVEGQEGCTAEALVNPPAGECTTKSFRFDVAVPKFDSGPVEGQFQVTIPYLELEQGQRVVDRLSAGEDASLVIQQEVGTQNYPQRQFMLDFSTSYTPVPDHDSIPATDCFPISAP